MLDHADKTPKTCVHDVSCQHWEPYSVKQYSDFGLRYETWSRGLSRLRPKGDGCAKQESGLLID